LYTLTISTLPASFSYAFGGDRSPAGRGRNLQRLNKLHSICTHAASEARVSLQSHAASEARVSLQSHAMLDCMRIAFVHTKGGVGKTTSALMLALAAVYDKQPVVVYDADWQHSARRWADVANQRGIDLGFDVIPINSNGLRQLPPNSHLEIIDTPPGQAQEIQAAIDVADLIIVPTGASPMDLDRVWPTLKTMSGRKVGVLLTGVTLRHVLYQETRALFENQQIPTFYHTVPQREAIKAAFGTAPTDLQGYEKIYQEIMEIEEL